ncbi:hypothetical protein D3C75_1017660 [compost metagenome]
MLSLVFPLATLAYKLESTRSQEIFRVKLGAIVNIDFELTLSCIIVFNINIKKEGRESDVYDKSGVRKNGINSLYDSLL